MMSLLFIALEDQDQYQYCRRGGILQYDHPVYPSQPTYYGMMRLLLEDSSHNPPIT
jgi:hypothetical protein